MKVRGLRLFALTLTLLLGACSDESGDSTAAPADTPVPAASAALPAAPPPAAMPIAAEPAPSPDAVADTAVAQAVAEPAEPPAVDPNSGGAAADAPVPAVAGDAASAPQYVVECPAGATAAEQCQVDKNTYIGWRSYASQCFQCHGASGMGTTFAPNLMERINAGVDHPRFVHSVIYGYRGQMGAMPAWKGNSQVEPNVDNLWRYLKARADDALPAGRPARIPEG
ncbi:MAG: c-type cytochrome [Gammaproteobacteria bacterium]|nr:c-type cytochrome [Gammaproteobacteria bacterium]